MNMSADWQERFESKLVSSLKGFNGLLHVLLAVALVVASLMIVWQFAAEVATALRDGQLARGFLHALGTLFIVWTLSSLISAEIEYVATSRFQLRVFIEVAMITLLRQLIVEPVQVVAGPAGTETGFNEWHYGMVLAAILVVGVVHRLVGSGIAKLETAMPLTSESGK
jgi:uncharacterized membrane protein (DUF373 family)